MKSFSIQEKNVLYRGINIYPLFSKGNLFTKDDFNKKELSSIKWDRISNKIDFESIFDGIPYLVAERKVSSLSKKLRDGLNEQTLSYLREQMESPEIISYLKDKNKPLSNRSRELRKNLKLCVDVLYSLDCATSPNSWRIKYSSERARLDDDYNNADSSFRFGLNNSSYTSASSTFFGVLFHELMHKILNDEFNLQATNLDNNSIHEFTSDMAVLASYGQIAGSNTNLFNKWSMKYTKHLEFEENFLLQYGRSYGCEDHIIARATIYKLFKEAKEKGIDFAVFSSLLFDSSINVIKSMYQSGELNKLKFDNFMQMVLIDLNQELKKVGLEALLLEPKDFGYQDTSLPTNKSVNVPNVAVFGFGELALMKRGFTNQTEYINRAILIEPSA